MQCAQIPNEPSGQRAFPRCRNSSETESRRQSVRTRGIDHRVHLEGLFALQSIDQQPKRTLRTDGMSRKVRSRKSRSCPFGDMGNTLF
jgi:hypothetical protein